MKNFIFENTISKTDNKYKPLFEYRKKLQKVNNKCNINNISMSNSLSTGNISIIDKPSFTTNKKLNQIILNNEQKNKKIRQKLFKGNKTNNNEHNKLYERIKDLIMQKKEGEKKHIIYNRERLDGIHQSIKRLSKWNKKFALNQSFLEIIFKENHKTPPICRYTPNLQSIEKHIPVPDLKGHQHFSLKKLKKEEEDKRKIGQKINIYNKKKLKFDECNNSIINKEKEYNSLNNSSISKKNNFYNNINKYERNDIRYYSNSIDGKINNNNSKNYDNINNPSLLSHSVSNEIIPLNPNKAKNIISIPNFKKMLSRDKYSYINNESYFGNYFPNYDSIYSNVYKYLKNNQGYRNKKNKLRKILGKSNPPSEYLLLPILNKNN